MMYRQGDIVFVPFQPTRGHEQRGYRPALVIQNSSVTHALRSCVIVLPITTSNTRLPFEVELDERTKTRGHVLCRHIRALDLFERQAEVVEQVPDDILRKCISYVKLLISCDEEKN